MSVYELLEPKKNWTNLDIVSLIANDLTATNITANKITANELNINRIITHGNYLYITAAGTTILTPIDIVGSTIGCSSSQLQTLQLPTATELDLFFENGQGFIFTFNVYNTGAQSIIIQLGTDTFVFNGLSIVTQPHFLQQTITYVRDLSGWIVYAAGQAP